MYWLWCFMKICWKNGLGMKEVGDSVRLFILCLLVEVVARGRNEVTYHFFIDVANFNLIKKNLSRT